MEGTQVPASRFGVNVHSITDGLFVGIRLLHVYPPKSTVRSLMVNLVILGSVNVN